MANIFGLETLPVKIANVHIGQTLTVKGMLSGVTSIMGGDTPFQGLLFKLRRPKYVDGKLNSAIVLCSNIGTDYYITEFQQQEDGNMYSVELPRKSRYWSYNGACKNYKGMVAQEIMTCVFKYTVYSKNNPSARREMLHTIVRVDNGDIRLIHEINEKKKGIAPQPLVKGGMYATLSIAEPFNWAGLAGG